MLEQAEESLNQVAVVERSIVQDEDEGLRGIDNGEQVVEESQTGEAVLGGSGLEGDVTGTPVVDPEQMECVLRS